MPDVYRGGNGSVGVQAQQIIGNVHAHAARHREALAKMLSMRRHATIARIVALADAGARVGVPPAASRWRCPLNVGN